MICRMAKWKHLYKKNIYNYSFNYMVGNRLNKKYEFLCFVLYFKLDFINKSYRIIYMNRWISITKIIPVPFKVIITLTRIVYLKPQHNSSENTRRSKPVAKSNLFSRISPIKTNITTSQKISHCLRKITKQIDKLFSSINIFLTIISMRDSNPKILH